MELIRGLVVKAESIFDLWRNNSPIRETLKVERQSRSRGVVARTGVFWVRIPAGTFEREEGLMVKRIVDTIEEFVEEYVEEPLEEVVHEIEECYDCLYNHLNNRVPLRPPGELREVNE